MCEFEDLIYDFHFGNLAGSEKEKVSLHLKNCKECSQKLLEIQKLENLLQKHERPDVPQNINEDINTFFSNTFQTMPKQKRFELTDLNKDFSDKIKLLVTAAAVLFAGIFIGQKYFTHQEMSQNYASNDLQLLNEYVINSEILLLSFSNSSFSNASSNIDMDINKSLAQNLLTKSNHLGTYAQRLKDKDLILFLSRLEIFLLEISNSNEKEILEKFQELREMINEKKLVEKTKHLQKILNRKTKTGA